MPLARRLKSQTGEQARSFAEYLAQQAVLAVWRGRRSKCYSISNWRKCLLLSASATGLRRAYGLSRTRASECCPGSCWRSACQPPVSVLPAHSAACARVAPHSGNHRLFAHRFSGLRHPLTAAPELSASTVRRFSDELGRAEPTLAPSGFPDQPLVRA